MTTNIVIPMAGRGVRFLAEGYTEPKPMISVGGLPMYARAVASVPMMSCRHLIFVCLKEHLDLGLRLDLNVRYPRAKIVELERPTYGQACTVLAARYYINNSDPLIIHNADTIVEHDVADYPPPQCEGFAGVLSVFKARGNHWSFAKTGKDGKVIATAEKQRISPLASTGFYWFAHGADFVRHAEAAVLEGDVVRNEYYVAPLYNRIIRDGGSVGVSLAKRVVNLGTPEELKRNGGKV